MRARRRNSPPDKHAVMLHIRFCADDAEFIRRVTREENCSITDFVYRHFSAGYESVMGESFASRVEKEIERYRAESKELLPDEPQEIKKIKTKRSGTPIKRSWKKVIRQPK